MKICSKCGIEKKDEDFSFSNKVKGIRHGWCRSCVSIRSAHYRKINKDKITKDKQEYYQNHREEILDGQKLYNDDHKGDKKKYDETYFQNNKEKRSNYLLENKEEISNTRKRYRKNRCAVDFAFRTREILSSVIRCKLKNNGGSKNNQSFLSFIPWTIDQLIQHMEKQFEGWMNWNNYGKYNRKTWIDNDQSTWTWQIDHIIPQADLPYVSMEDDNFKRCWALKNLRPYSAKQNIIDGVKRIRHSK